MCHCSRSNRTAFAMFTDGNRQAVARQCHETLRCEHEMLNRAIQRTSTLVGFKHCSKSIKRNGRVVTRVEDSECSAGCAAEVLRRAAAAAARSVHAVRLGSAVGAFDAAEARRGAAALKRIRALTPDAMWRAPQKKLEESVELAGPYTREPAAGAADRRRSVPPLARAAEDHPRPAAGRAPGAEAAAAARRSGRPSHAAVRRRSCDSAGRRARQPRRHAGSATARRPASSGSRRGRSRTRSIRELPPSVDAVSPRVPLSVPSRRRPRARKATRTAPSVRC